MPACRCFAIASTAETMYDMSGSLVLRSGVGTQMLMVSRSLTTAKSVVASSRPACFSAVTSAVETSGMYDRPASISVDLPLVEVDAGRVEAGARQLHGERQADITEADDTGSGTARLNLLQQGGCELRHSMLLDLTGSADARLYFQLFSIQLFSGRGGGPSMNRLNRAQRVLLRRLEPRRPPAPPRALPKAARPREPPAPAPPDAAPAAAGTPRPARAADRPAPARAAGGPAHADRSARPALRAPRRSARSPAWRSPMGSPRQKPPAQPPGRFRPRRQARRPPGGARDPHWRVAGEGSTPVVSSSTSTSRISGRSTWRRSSAYPKTSAASQITFMTRGIPRLRA